MSGSNIKSAYEVGNGFALPQAPGEKIIRFDDELRNVLHELIARRKLENILYSHLLNRWVFETSNLKQVHVRNSHEKWDNWPSLRQIVAFYQDAGILTVLNIAGKSHSGVWIWLCRVSITRSYWFCDLRDQWAPLQCKQRTCHAIFRDLPSTRSRATSKK